MNKLVRRAFRLLGHDVVRVRKIGKAYLPSTACRDFAAHELDIIHQVKPFTMTPPERILAALRAADYVARNNIPGSIVECGVWRGGSMMAMALALLRLNRNDIPLYLFDTFEGMAKPSAVDGAKVCQRWQAAQNGNHSDWCFASLADVQHNLRSTGYPDQRLHFIQGKVEDTIPAAAPNQIALLRLDTDWYESTRHELEHLFPRLSRGGVLIIDDYGYWEGCRKAVDEYIEKNNLILFLNRIDNNARIAIKV